MQVSHRPSDGFTLVEMIVVLILLTVMMAVVGRLIVDALTHSNQSGQERKATNKVTNARDMLAADLRGAYSPDLDDKTEFQIRDRIDGTIAPTPADDIRIITNAQATSMTFRSDVVRETLGSAPLGTTPPLPALPECVTWRVVVAPPDNYLERIVTPGSNWQSCAGPPITHEKITRVDTSTTLFHYVYRDATCALQTTTGFLPGDLRMHRIVGVRLRVDGLYGGSTQEVNAIGGNMTASHRLRGNITMRAHTNDTYQRAMGCR